MNINELDPIEKKSSTFNKRKESDIDKRFNKVLKTKNHKRAWAMNLALIFIVIALAGLMTIIFEDASPWVYFVTSASWFLSTIFRLIRSFTWMFLLGFFNSIAPIMLYIQNF